MAEQSGFFDANLVDGEYDRVYLAESFAKYFASFIGNGIFGGKSNELMVQQKSTADMSIKVLSGQGWINGYWYENDDELSLAVDVADGVLNRIDAIVLRWDKIERVIRLAIKKGTPSAYPSVPVVTRNADYYELMLAKINVKAGITKITQAEIIDCRLDNEVCGLVTAVIQHFDTEEFGAQLNSYIEQFESNATSWLNTFKTNSGTSFNNFMSRSESTFNTFMTESRGEIDRLTSELQTLVESNEFVLLQEKVADILSRVITLETAVATLKTDVSTLKADNSTNKADIVNLKTSMNKLNALFVESGPNPGCFYRVAASGENEWINPPNEVGIAYRTTERRNGKPVYQKTIFIGALSNKAAISIEIDVEYDKIISIAGYAVDSENIMSYPFPIILNGLTPIAAISGVEGNGAVSYITINVNEDLSVFSGYITIKYTKA